MALLSVVTGQDSEVEKINRALQCLDGKVENNPLLTLEEAVFSILARVPDDKLKNKINNEKDNNGHCWPKSGCTVKDTARVLLAKLVLEEEVSEIVDWLKTQTSSSKDLTWYLQITTSNNGPATCQINYEGFEGRIEINEDMKLEGNAGSCLSITNTGYWLQISSSCVDKTFAVSCDGEFDRFITNLLYIKHTFSIAILIII